MLYPYVTRIAKSGTPCVKTNYRFLRKFSLKDTCVFKEILFVNVGRNRRAIHSSTVAYSFWEKEPKSGYINKDREKLSHVQTIRHGLNELKHEIGVWKEEVKEHLTADPIMVYRPGETDVFWKFDTEECLHTWVTTCDSDHKEGYSTCCLSITEHGKGLFTGVLSTEVPKDGRIKKAGYCNMRTMRVQKSFKRDSYHNWEMYTHLIVRVRGDGRSYQLNISTMGYFDIHWNDVYHYALYTRGGPYWQVAKIPFSKFFLASKGRIQDKQAPLPLNRVSHFGITAADSINGPFRLEIDYIGVEYDPSHTEEFAYEMYRIPDNLI